MLTCLIWTVGQLSVIMESQLTITYHALALESANSELKSADSSVESNTGLLVDKYRDRQVDDSLFCYYNILVTG